MTDERPGQIEAEYVGGPLDGFSRVREKSGFLNSVTESLDGKRTLVYHLVTSGRGILHEQRMYFIYQFAGYLP